MVKIYHNNRCRKSREGLELLGSLAKDIEIIEYLKNTPTKSELTDVVKMLRIKPFDLLRKNEDIYKKEFKGKELSDNEWIDAMLKYPKLIERPIVIKDNKAVLARPADKIKELF